MSRRGENIYKRKDGRWEGRISKPDGKYQSLYAKSYREVKEKMRLFIEEKSSFHARQGLRKREVDETFVCWLENSVFARVKPSTYESYYYCVQKYIRPFFQQQGNNQITEDTVTCFVKSMKDNHALSDASKKKVLSVFKIALKEILRNTPNSLNIIELVRLPKPKVKEVQVFSLKEQQLIEHMAIQSEDKRAMAIVLCFYTGLRLGELCALKWSDIDIETGILSISRTVTRIKNFGSSDCKSSLVVGTPKSSTSIRKIPLPDFMIKEIKENDYCNIYKNCYMFSGKEEPLDPRICQNIYKKLLSKNQLTDRKFHTLRHTFATRALELGVDIKTLSEILGHSNVSITLNIYTHSHMEQKKLAISKFAQLHIAI